MIPHPPSLQRHQLVWLDHAQWRRLANAAWNPETRACLAHWQHHQLPLVVTRQRSPSHPEIHLGLPAPDHWGRMRLLVSVPRSAIDAIGCFPPAGMAARLLPAAGQGAWQKLCAHWQDGGCQARVYGSHGWQLISGQPYLREGSDLDLILPVHDARHADALADTLNAGHVSGLPKLDGELIFPDHSAVHWREWRQWRSGKVSQVLVKRMDSVRLHTAPWWSEALSAVETTESMRTCTAIGHAAVHALHDELALSPKPGLVSFQDSGSHRDMDADTLMRSVLALRDYFTRITELGFQCAPFAALNACGRAAEQRMLVASGGVNTHRGAVFMLGLLCAAAGRVLASGTNFSVAAIRAALLEHWGAALAVHACRSSALPGGSLARRHGLGSAAQQAAQGFPVVFEVGVPAFVGARASGLQRTHAQLHSFFAMLSVLDDSNLVRRGGLVGLRFAKAAAADFLHHGGAAAHDALPRARAIHHAFVARRLSPGGVADALAATCWLMRLTGGK